MCGRDDNEINDFISSFSSLRQRRLIEENDTECEISPQMSFLADEVAPSKVEGAC